MISTENTIRNWNTFFYNHDTKETVKIQKYRNILYLNFTYLNVYLNFIILLFHFYMSHCIM